MRKTLCAAVAVALAVAAAWTAGASVPLTPQQKRLFGSEERLPLSVVAMGSEQVVRHPLGFPYVRPGQGNAVLVDARLGLYLTVAHMLPPPGSAFFVIRRDSRTFPVRTAAAWTDPAADLAVIAAGPESVPEGAREVRFMNGPPGVGEVLTMKGYHALRRFGRTEEIVLHGFAKRFQVILPASDACVTPALCTQTERLREEMTMGRLWFTADEVNLLYPHTIYVAYQGSARFGVVSGLSGSPLVTSGGALAGLVSAHPGSDRFGRYGFVAPAHQARRLLMRAQRDLSGS